MNGRACGVKMTTRAGPRATGTFLSVTPGTRATTSPPDLFGKVRVMVREAQARDCEEQRNVLTLGRNFFRTQEACGPGRFPCPEGLFL